MIFEFIFVHTKSEVFSKKFALNFLKYTLTKNNDIFQHVKWQFSQHKRFFNDFGNFRINSDASDYVR